MKKLLALYLIIIMALVWTVAVAGSMENAATITSNQQVKIDKVGEGTGQKAVNNEMTAEKAARIAADQAFQAVGQEAVHEVLGNYVGEIVPQPFNSTDAPVSVAPFGEPVKAPDAETRMKDIKRDGVIDAGERAEYEQLLADQPVVEIPMPLNIVSETEPNDDCASADPIACGDTVWCATHTYGNDDHDWYTFTLTSDQNVAIETHPTSGACDPAMSDTYLELWTGDCQTFITADDDGGVGWFSLISMNLAAGTYAIHSDNSIYAQAGSYHLSLICTSPQPIWNCTDTPPDGKLPGGNIDVEPNEICAEAVIAQCEYAYCGDISTDADSDWYAITLPSDTTYSLHIRVFGDDTPNQYAQGLGLDPRVELWGPGCTDMVAYSEDYLGTFPDAENWDSQIDPGIPGNCFPAGSTVYIKVWTYYSAPGPYLLIINCEPCEVCPPPPNDNCEDVTPTILTPGVPTTFTGNNECATNQCSYFPGGHVWEAFTTTIPGDISLEYCGSVGVWQNAWLNLTTDCPCTGFTDAASFGFTCVDSNVQMVWENFPAGTYYYPVMLDPALGSEGDYTITVRVDSLIQCDVVCDPGWTDEGEPDCYDDYEDVTNGGCNSTPNVWGSITSGDTICGTTGDYTYQGNPGYRDTDWFQFTLTQTSDISATICSETNVALYLLDASDCNNVQFLGTANGTPCDTVTAAASAVPPGTYVVWVGSDGSGFPCGSDYWVTLQATPLVGDWRCCYGDPYAPSCIDTDELTCYGTYNGEWSYNLTCIDNPCPAIPANDSCQDAITIAVPSDTYGSTILATPDTTETCNGYDHYANGVWYKVVGTGNTITATTCDSLTDYDTKILVWCNGCNYPICATANDDNCALPGHSLNSTATWCSEPGTEYLVLVGGFGTNSGSYMLHVYDDGTPCSTPPDCAAPIGRCCYNNDQSCVDNTREECDALAGSWDGTKNCTDDPCICPESEVIVEIFTDDYPDETTWDLTDSLGTVLATGGPLSNSGTLYSWQVCVDSINCYYFTIYDAFGDGICCDWGQGYYNVYLDGNLVATGGQFGSFETTMFGPTCVMPTGACCVDEQCVATNTEDECDVLGGSWFLGETCPDFQCPPPPLDCANAEYSNGIDDFVDVYASQCDPANVFVVETADDFVLAADANITTISAFVGFWSNASCGIEGLTGITAVIYNDNGGVPGGNPVDSNCTHTGNVVWEHYYTPGEWVATDIGGPSRDHQIDLPTGGVALTAGTTYWLGIMTHFDLVTCGQAGWTPTLQQTGSVPLLWSTYFGIYWTDPFLNGYDMAFCLHTGGGGGCDYIVGDVNGSNNYNGLDITYGVNFFKYGNPPPQCNPDCPPCAGWHYCGDVNNSCNYNGLDITYGVNYFKYGSPAPIPCDDCPPVGLTGENREPETPQVIKSKTVNPKGSDAK